LLLSLQQADFSFSTLAQIPAQGFFYAGRRRKEKPSKPKQGGLVEMLRFSWQTDLRRPFRP